MISISRFLLLSTLALTMLVIRQPACAQEEDEDESHEDPAARARWRFQQRANANGEIPADALMKAKAQMDRLRLEAPPRMDAGISNWEWLGPGDIGGRIRSILFHPSNPNTIWVGSVSGGIWRTNNGGTSWSPVDDFMANLAVTSIVMDPTNMNILYASTGEGFGNTDLRGAGIYKSVDGGVTWSRLPATNGPDFQFTNRLVHHPSVANTLLAGTGTSRVFRSIDGGATWNVVLNTPSAVTDIKYHPVFQNNVLVGTANDFYLSADGGNNWQRQTTGAVNKLPFSPGRCEGDFSSTDSVVYVSIDRNFTGAVWRSPNGGRTWAPRDTLTNYMGGQGWYDNCIWVDPTNSNTLVVGGRNLQRSTDGGLTLTLIGGASGARVPNVHADMHAIVQHPSYNGVTNRIVFVGCDGGFYRANDILTAGMSSGWQALNNGLGITQFYGGAAAPDGSVISGGAQDNDRLHYTPAGGINGWYVAGGTAPGGDGTGSAIDYYNPQRMYMEATGLSISRSDDGGRNYSPKTNGIVDVGAWVSPLVMDPINASTLMAGGTKIWKTTDAAESWNLKRTEHAGSPTCSAMDIASNSNVILIGYSDGTVSRSPDGGESWTDISTPPLPNGRAVTSVAINPVNANEVFVTFGGYSTDQVWMTTNAGSSWINRSGSGSFALPDIQVNTIRYNPLNTNWIYVGTDLGVLASDDRGATWNVTPRFAGSEGPMNVEVDQLFWQGASNLIAATHGRGMFRTRVLTIVYVDVSNMGTEDGTFLHPYRTVQAAIDASGPGSTISIASGTYPEAPLTFVKRGRVEARNGVVQIIGPANIPRMNQTTDHNEHLNTPTGQQEITKEKK